MRGMCSRELYLDNVFFIGMCYKWDSLPLLYTLVGREGTVDVPTCIEGGGGGIKDMCPIMTDLLSSVSSSWCVCFSFSLSCKVFCSVTMVFSFSWSRWDRLAAVLPFREYIAIS